MSEEESDIEATREAKVKSKSKKRRAEDPELEIDVNAPEPPSKKALRKAKKVKVESDSKPARATADDTDLKRLNGVDSERSKFGIWIGNLEFTTTKKDLYKFLLTNSIFPLQPEQITRIHLPPGKDHRAENRGFAYVDLVSQDLVLEAVKLSETLLTGRRLLIKDANNFQGRPEAKNAKVESPAHPPSRKIFVGNLDFDTTKDALEKHFSVCGPIFKSQLATFEDSGKCKGYAWVEFESLFAAEAAMRGWTEVAARKKGMKEGEEGTKRVWLHRMGERKLRLEFAEDSTSRYNKRFGKNANLGHGDENEDGERAVDERKHVSRPAKELRPSESEMRKKNRQDSSSKKSDYRYDRSTVQKMTGAMIEGEGKKVLFD